MIYYRDQCFKCKVLQGQVIYTYNIRFAGLDGTYIQHRRPSAVSSYKVAKYTCGVLEAIMNTPESFGD